ncbi:MAG: hypothetical protein IC227_05780 [Enterococcus lacertideformus]|uniref:Uncharacterized protein n=1 Tax=Enterococcus lacertideformus TaxID=2771493 RepID=A0A931B026_9ENTE|nr:hypothetical protein [Enterococcus lacertideformus]
MKELISLEDFLSMDIEEAVKYDFKKEIFKLRGLDYDQYQEIERMLIYKGNIFMKESDCDRITLTLDIYNALWGDEIGNYFSGGVPEKFIPSNGETMNSFTRINKIYTDMIMKDKKYHFECDELNEFAILTHTLGNFIPVYSDYEKNSSPFNAYRNFNTHDYWDLTIMDIKDYIVNEKENSRYIKNSTNWFDNYRNSDFDKGFNTFCDKHFLDDWKLEEEQTNEEWNKKNLFWKNHDLNRQTISHFGNKDGEELFKVMLRKINHSIVSRGRLMFKKLKRVSEANYTD